MFVELFPFGRKVVGVALISLFMNPPAGADDEGFLVEFSFGEIPILAGSFKPPLSVGWVLNDHLELGYTFQLSDSLDRGVSSFNAQFGQQGLISSRERTGHRHLLQVRAYPFRDWFYLSGGIVMGGKDVEVLSFDQRLRPLGTGTYASSLRVTRSRSFGVRPAVGAGLEAPLGSSGFSVCADFTMDFLGGVPSPKLEIEGVSGLRDVDRAEFEQQIRDTYTDNFHNRYHVFNLGVRYRF